MKRSNYTAAGNVVLILVNIYQGYMLMLFSYRHVSATAAAVSNKNVLTRQTSKWAPSKNTVISTDCWRNRFVTIDDVTKLTQFVTV